MFQSKSRAGKREARIRIRIYTLAAEGLQEWGAMALRDWLQPGGRMLLHGPRMQLKVVRVSPKDPDAIYMDRI